MNELLKHKPQDTAVRVVNLEKLLQYNLSVQVYGIDTDIPVMSFCNGFSVRNIGTCPLVIMGDPLAPGEVKNIGGNRGEIYVGRIDLRFNNTGALSQQCLVTQKYYMNIPRNNEIL
jgi:hypothetical protein